MIHQSGTKLRTEEYARLVNSDLTQTEKVKQVFINRPEFAYTAEDVHLIAFDSSTPLTSVRRCLSDLFANGFLDKLEGANKKPGRYGVKLCKYILKREGNQLRLL